MYCSNITAVFLYVLCPQFQNAKAQNVQKFTRYFASRRWIPGVTQYYFGDYSPWWSGGGARNAEDGSGINGRNGSTAIHQRVNNGWWPEETRPASCTADVHPRTMTSERRRQFYDIQFHWSIAGYFLPVTGSIACLCHTLSRLILYKLLRKCHKSLKKLGRVFILKIKQKRWLKRWTPFTWRFG